MTGRDRIVVIAIALLLVLGAGWLLVVSPERKQAATLDAQVSTARAQLASAKTQVANASGAQAKYESAYTSIVSLGKAVPASQEVPSLMYQIAQATHQKHVEFQSITSGNGSSGPGSTPTAAAAAAGGFTQMPFTFVFNGSFFDLEHLFRQLTSFTTQTASGGLRVSGRLLTIQSVKLTPIASSLFTEQSKGAVSELAGTITATAYVLPGGQALTGAATSASPTGAAASATSTTGASRSPTAPAIARVNP